MKHLKHDDDVRPEFEAVQILHYAVSTFRVDASLFVSIPQLFE